MFYPLCDSFIGSIHVDLYSGQNGNPKPDIPIAIVSQMQWFKIWGVHVLM